jgi:DNA-directed RNA polymerase subunit L
LEYVRAIHKPLVIAYKYFMPHPSLKNWENRIRFNDGEEKWIFSESMLSAITAAQRAR